VFDPPGAADIRGESQRALRTTTMDEQAVREQAQAHVEALLAGDIERATEHFSNELRRDLGQVMAQLPLPLAEGTVESVEMAGSGYIATLHLVGETDVRFQTRWKDRDGTPTMVEISHIAEPEPVTQVEPTEPETQA
jgi:hypothetical protein